MKLLQVLFVSSFVISSGLCVVLQLVNHLDGPISVGALARSGFPLPNGGGWLLQKGKRKSIHLPDNWAGRFWARTWCIEDDANCQTGDCGQFECRGSKGKSPATIALFVFRGKNYIDYYSISLEDGFNTKLVITPLNKRGAKSRCKEISCTADINYDCSKDLVVNYEGKPIGCRSACDVYGDEEFCCTGPHNTTDTCKPNKYSRFFKQRCPQTQSFKYDHVNSVFGCQADNYILTFS